MSKLSLVDLASGYGLPAVYNANNDALIAALENTVSRDGTAPNDMLADLDMSGKKILNSGPATSATDLVRLGDLPVPAVELATLTAELIGDYLQPQTDGENNVSIDPDTIYGSVPYDIRRAGVIVDSSNGAIISANTSAIQNLLDPEQPGPSGVIVFPNENGLAQYNFNDFVQVRDGVTLDLCGSTLAFAKTFAVGDYARGFLEFIKNVTLKNGKIVIDYDSTGWPNTPGLAAPANGVRVGMRPGYSFGAYSSGEEEDLPYFMGGCLLENIDIVTNNDTTAASLLLLGGLINCKFKNVTVNGQSVADKGIYYEMGSWHYEATVANRTSAHAINLQFENVHVNDIENSAGTAFSIVGAMSTKIDGLCIDGTWTGALFRCGEALYYNMGPKWTGLKPFVKLTNYICKNNVSTGLSLLGVELASSGFLSGSGLTEAQQTDHISFFVDGVRIYGPGIVVNCPHLGLYNARLAANGATGAGLWLQNETMFFDLGNVRITGYGLNGIRSDTGGNIWATPRFRQGQIRNSFVAGNGVTAHAAGIALSNMKGVLVENTRLGYETIHDGQSESTQGSGVSIASTTTNVTIQNCYGADTWDASSPMYVNAGSGGWKFARLRGCTGDQTTSGQFEIDGGGEDLPGDANITFDVGTDLPTQRFATALTANRTVTLGTATAYKGARGKFIRTAGGAFTLAIGALKTIPAGTAAVVEIEYDGAAWVLSGYQLL